MRGHSLMIAADGQEHPVAEAMDTLARHMNIAEGILCQNTVYGKSAAALRSTAACGVINLERLSGAPGFPERAKNQLTPLPPDAISYDYISRLAMVGQRGGREKKAATR